MHMSACVTGNIITAACDCPYVVQMLPFLQEASAAADAARHEAASAKAALSANEQLVSALKVSLQQPLQQPLLHHFAGLI